MCCLTPRVVGMDFYDHNTGGGIIITQNRYDSQGWKLTGVFQVFPLFLFRWCKINMSFLILKIHIIHSSEELDFVVHCRQSPFS